ncbi:HAMP domain-containing histidine kinase [Paenibacillus athensensis]|uniref:histidine kinase n=1 Tax=Paenibacillus athensensis TaxID=1967502 RepID=A0A4Y8PYV7_9BACL|nr:HAMP domain-containing sensor histidine kinase [Paenibacillus athensensis]MCD1260419.1 HAMP domain-containing histidine kinase [Paenibacillus athensensis]
MRTVKVRTLLLAAVFLITTLSWMTYVVVLLAETGSLRIGDGEPSRTGLGLAAVIGLLGGVAVFGYGLHRWVIRPLEATAAAARQIAEGELEVKLPSSGVREIAEVKIGFEAMVAGLRRSMERQGTLEEERRFVIGAIAHDLRTPLFALNGYLEGLKRGIASTPEQVERYVNVCMDKSAQLDRLVADLLIFAKTEYMEAQLQTQQVALAGLLGKAIETISHLAEAKQLVFHLTAPPESNQDNTVCADAYLLERAFNNLLDNAVRHTPGGGVIHVSWSRSAAGAEVVIRDSGTGIPEAERERVFEPLYRGEASRNRESGGSGLGLTIARRIFQAHGGHLSIANHPEGGAVVTGWLPMQRNPAE